MNKKRIFAIAVFIILSLFMYTFANPLNDNKEDGKPEQPANGENTNAPTASNEGNTLGNPTRNTRRTANNNNNVPVVATPATADNTTPVVVPAAVETNLPVEVKPEENKPADNKPEVKPTPVIDLTIDKLNAIDELKKYKADYEFEDDTDYKKVIEDYTKLINDSKSLDEIKKTLQDGKDAIDKLIEEDLTAYKDAAKTEIATYAASLDLTTDVTDLLKGYYDDIDDATTKKAIDEIVKKAKEELDKIKAGEIAAAKEEAKKEIEEQNKEDETNLPDIVDIKDKGKDAVDKAETIEDITEAKNETLEAIKDYIDSVEYTVTFYGIKGKKLATETVGYKGNILEKAPTMKKNITEWSGSIKLEFLGWDVEDDAVATGNVTVHTRYKVLSATTKISILKEDLGYDYSTDIKDFNHPYNKPEATKDTYLKLNITDEIEKAVNDYTNAHIFVYFSEPSKHDAMVTGDRAAIDKTIRDVVVDAPTTYNNNKYKAVQFYVLKLQGDRFHCDARVLYDKEQEEADRKAAELAAAKEAAIKELKDYRKDKEAYISEITDEKEAAYTNINNATTLDEVAKALQDGKDAVDAWADKTVNVTFNGFNGLTKTVKVGYKKDASFPTSADFTAPVRKNVTYELTGWDKTAKDLKEITAPVTATASYKVAKVVAKVYQRTDKNEIPTDKLYDGTLRFKQILKETEVEIKLTKEVLENVANDKYYLFAETDAAIRALDKNNVLPKNTDKYHTYVFYGMKLCNDGYHIDGALIYDELADKTDELKELIKAAKALDTTGKTTASIKDLNDAIGDAEKAIKDKDLKAIKESIKTLTNPSKYLVTIKVTEVTVVDKKKDHKYVEGQDFVLEVKYSNNNGVKDKVIESGYTINADTKTVGNNQKATVTYKGVTSNEFTFNVIKKEISSIKVESAKYEYFLNEAAKLTVTATYNDGSTRKLNADEYTSTFYSNKTTYTGWFGANEPRTATVTANGKKATFKYSVSTYTQDAWNKELIKKVSIHVSNGYIQFKNATDDMTIKTVQRVNKKVFSNDKIFNIDLIATDDKHKFKLYDDDYSMLRNTNTFFANQYIRITFVINGKEYTRDYSEIFGDVF